MKHFHSLPSLRHFEDHNYVCLSIRLMAQSTCDWVTFLKVFLHHQSSQQQSNCNWFFSRLCKSFPVLLELRCAHLVANNIENKKVQRIKRSSKAFIQIKENENKNTLFEESIASMYLS